MDDNLCDSQMLSKWDDFTSYSKAMNVYGVGSGPNRTTWDSLLMFPCWRIHLYLLSTFVSRCHSSNVLEKRIKFDLLVWHSLTRARTCWWSRPSSTRAWFNKPIFFHYGSISLIDETTRSTNMKAMKLAKEAQVLLSYDTNFAPSPLADPWSIWKEVDVMKILDDGRGERVDNTQEEWHCLRSLAPKSQIAPHHRQRQQVPIHTLNVSLAKLSRSM